MIRRKKNNTRFYFRLFFALICLNFLILLFYWRSFEDELAEDPKAFLEYTNINVPDFPIDPYTFNDCAPVKCDYQSQRCLEPSDYFPVSKNSLPCCSQLLEMILIDWKKLFSLQTHMQYFLMYGTLLGAVRNNSIIRGTLDVDVVIRPSTLEFLTSERSKQLLWDHGYLIFEDNDMGRVCFARHMRNGLLKKWFFEQYFNGSYHYIADHPYMDLYTEITEKPNENSTRKHRSQQSVLTFRNGPCEFAQSWIYPLSEVVINGRRYPAPRKSLGLVEYLYGHDWKIPMENKHGTIHSCVGLKLNI